jgi:hypothetical protein
VGILLPFGWIGLVQWSVALVIAGLLGADWVSSHSFARPIFSEDTRSGLTKLFFRLKYVGFVCVAIGSLAALD